jgi:hypothetical protein
MDIAAPSPRSISNRSILDFVVRRLPGFSSLLFAMLVSRQLVGFPFYGGIWFLTGQILLLCSEAFYKAYKEMFSAKRRLLYALAAVCSSVCCLVVTLFFLNQIQLKHALTLLVFVANELAGVAMLEGSALMPISERSKLAVNLSSFTVVSAAAIVVCRFVFGLAVPWLIVLYDIVFLTLLCLKAVFAPKQEMVALEGHQTPVDDMEDIWAYKQYRKMVSNILVSIELSIMLLASYMLAIPANTDSQILLGGARLLAIFGISIWVCRVLLNKDRLNVLGSNIAFLLFSVLWIFINIYTVNHPAIVRGVSLVLPVALISLCMAALSAILLNMDRYMIVIGEIGQRSVTQANYALFKNAAYHWGAVVSRVVLLLLMAGVTILYGYSTKSDFVMAAILNRNKLFIIPIVFLVSAAISALHQPLTRYYEQKLGKYIHQKLDGKVSRALEQKLVLTLVKKSSKRIGIKLLRAAVKPFVLLKRVHVERINSHRFPCIFVCNHAEIFGPIAATVNIPFFNRPWIIHEMVDKDKIAAHLQTGFDHIQWIPKAIRTRLGRLFGPMMLWVMQSMDPIPVYRNSIKDISKTIALSTEALEADDSILIFPENPGATDGRYLVDGVGDFFEGFVHIARNFCRSTGKPLVFYSVYANSKTRTISFSEGIEFDADAPFTEERERICGYLHGEMVKMHQGLGSKQ